ncbi:MAG: universal stress protein [Aureispira sp.]|nr:universal stress protein [Aureispira sp.]
MNKILVPVDFSAASDWGFYYAYHLAQEFDGEIIVAHIYEEQSIDPNVQSYKKQDILDAQRDVLAVALRSATVAPKGSKKKVSVKYVLEPEDHRSIAAIAKDHEVELIIMGTHGAGGAWEKLWGTYTSAVIEEAECPVLAIPSGVQYSKIESVAYATNFDIGDIEVLKKMASFAGLIGAPLHCIHINVLSDPTHADDEKAFKELFKKTFENFDADYTLRASISVEDGLETFLRVNNISILSMLTHKRTLWESLFGVASATRTMALETKIPLLAFHKGS